MATAITPLANITLSSSASNVTFSSISQSYRDLLLVLAPTSASTEELVIQMNADTGNNYNYVFMRGTGSAASSYTASSASYITLGANSYSQTTAVLNSQISFLDYSTTGKHKSILIRNNDANYGVEAGAGRWANTAAITSIKIYGRFGANFTSGTTMALYGIVSA